MPRFGLSFLNFLTPGVPNERRFERLAEIARVAESTGGFDSLWVGDHFYHVLGGPMLEPYVLLGALAAVTTRLRLGVLVSVNSFRHPAMLAKLVTTLDVVSGGRAVLGIGAGVDAREHRDHGLEFPPLGERMDRLEETIQVCRALFRESAPSFAGRYYQLEGARVDPRPVQPGGPPILVGGKGERRTLRIVARYADLANFTYTSAAETARKLRALDDHCQRLGRDPASVRRTRAGAMIIASSHAEAERKGLAFRQARSMDEARYRDVVVYGEPVQIADQVACHAASGLDELYFGLPDAYDLEVVQMAGETLRRLRI
jgi:F420-dependent oxidoreductase-like protein